MHQEDVSSSIALAETCSRFNIDVETIIRTIAASSQRNIRVHNGLETLLKDKR